MSTKPQQTTVSTLTLESQVEDSTYTCKVYSYKEYSFTTTVEINGRYYRRFFSRVYFQCIVMMLRKVFFFSLIKAPLSLTFGDATLNEKLQVKHWIGRSISSDLLLKPEADSRVFEGTELTLTCSYISTIISEGSFFWIFNDKRCDTIACRFGLALRGQLHIYDTYTKSVTLLRTK